MTARKWPIHIAVLLLGSGLAVVTQSKGQAQSLKDVPCETGGCMQCVENNCGRLTFSQYLLDTMDTEEDRCVEYDGVPPAHCATVVVDNKLIYDVDPVMIVGDCAIINCSSGAPTPTQCAKAWVRPAGDPREPIVELSE